jgi:hypothetical protein
MARRKHKITRQAPMTSVRLAGPDETFSGWIADEKSICRYGTAQFFGPKQPPPSNWQETFEDKG